MISVLSINSADSSNMLHYSLQREKVKTGRDCDHPLIVSIGQQKSEQRNRKIGRSGHAVREAPDFGFA